MHGTCIGEWNDCRTKRTQVVLVVVMNGNACEAEQQKGHGSQDEERRESAGCLYMEIHAHGPCLRMFGSSTRQMSLDYPSWVYSIGAFSFVCTVCVV